MSHRPKLRAKFFNPSSPGRFSGNVVILVAVLLAAAYGIDLLAAAMGVQPFVYCWMVAWASQYGIGGSLALLMAVAGFLIWLVSRNARVGIYLIGGALLIKLMPLLLESYLGLGTPCALG